MLVFDSEDCPHISGPPIRKRFHTCSECGAVGCEDKEPALLAEIDRLKDALGRVAADD